MSQMKEKRREAGKIKLIWPQELELVGLSVAHPPLVGLLEVDERKHGSRGGGAG